MPTRREAIQARPFVGTLTVECAVQSHSELMQGDELLERCGRSALQQEGWGHGPVRPASPLEPGEDVASGRLEDADHWVAVYSELVEFKRDLLREIDRQARDMSHEAAQEISYNRRAFMLELQRMELHLDYWRERRERLRAVWSHSSVT